MWVLMLNDSVLGVYSTEANAEAAQREDQSWRERLNSDSQINRRLYYSIGMWTLDAKPTF